MSASPVLSADLVRDLDRQPGPEAWNRIRQTLLDLFSRDLPEDAVAESRKRDGLVAPLDLYLSTSAWDLWSGFGEWVPRTSHALKQWWQANGSGKAILILDGFSLRELSWFVTHAAGHRLRVKGIQVLGAEFPADTVPFAKA
ncbi:MAG TPA: hypothetical protein VK465_17365, partial [Fibrobacteria bacterium]|nr:hypothetical protein [Fibrobacteria bacterium]